MPRKPFDYLRRLNSPREVEDSWQLRIAVWASVSISILALALQGVTSMALGLASIALLSVGSFVSWRRRYRPNMVVKVVIMLLTVAALASFLRQVILQPYDPRIPLAELFVWVQVLHSFDLPRGKDLLLSLVSSFILLALAGSFSLNASFGLIILLWLAVAVPSLYFLQQSRLHDLSAKPERADLPRPSLRRITVVLTVLLVTVTLSGLAVGAFMPRISATYLRSLPFSIRRAFLSSDSYRFSNPGYPGLPFKPPQDALEFNPEAYFGFGTFLDLRSRGTLVDLPVMKVRATEPSYWSGLTFQEYNGYSWLTSEEEPEKLRTSVQPFDVDHDPNQAHMGGSTVIQTFYIEAEQPNVIFAAFRPDLLYYPADFIYEDESGLKSPFPLDDGLVYSVVSRHVASEKMLAASRAEAKAAAFSPYLELPPMPERVMQLSAEITPREKGPYARALAIEDFLRSEYEYSLDVPPLPAGEDAVDYFLFEHRRGYCEHFATAYAVLCRLAGIPSRVVTGYASGDYNPFTGLYEVSLDDAHAWVQIYIEGIGWVDREPTPSFSLPQSGQDSDALWIFRDFFSWMGRNLSALLPAPLRSALKSGANALISSAAAAVSGFLYSLREAPWLLFLLVAILLFLPLAWVARRLRRAHAPPRDALDEPLLAMDDFLGALAALGVIRDPSQTAGEFVGGLSALVPGLDLTGELMLFEQARYGGRTLGEEDERRLRGGLAAALEKIKQRLKSRARR